MGIPHLNLDYYFLGNGDGGDTITCIILKERYSRFLISYVVPAKGREEEVVDKLVKDIREMGIGESVPVVLKSDNENSIRAIVGMLRDRVHVQAPSEHNPRYDDQSKGIAERGVQSIEDQVRVSKLALEDNLGADIDVKHPIIHWLVAHSAWLLNRFEVGKDGRTAYQRVRGKHYKGFVFEFGEVVYGMEVPRQRGGSMGSKWIEGVWLGKKGDTDEHMVFSNNELKLVRSARPMTKDKKWNLELINSIRITPLRTTSPESSQPYLPIFPQHDREPEPRPDIPASAPIPRRVQVLRKHFERYGFTPTCRKCQAMMGKLKDSRKSFRHSEECTERVRARMREDPEYSEWMHERDTRYKDHQSQPDHLDEEPESAAQEPAEEAPRDEAPPDYWTRSGNRWIRHHRRPRTEMYTPREDDGGPDIQKLRPERWTFVDGEPRVHTDMWADHRVLPGPWTGRTSFESLEEDESEEQPPQPFPPQSFGSASSSGQIPEVGRTKREGDHFEPEAKRFRAEEDLEALRVTQGEQSEEMWCKPCYDVCEVFSPPRVTLAANHKGMTGGWSIDIAAEDGVTQRRYDLRDSVDRRLLLRRVREDKPMFIIGSPPCNLFSPFQAFNKHRDTEEWLRRYDEAVGFLELMVQIYRMQIAGGRYFVHEHPAHASSWGLPCIQSLLAREDVGATRVDMCQYGLQTEDSIGQAPAYKPITLLSNSPSVLNSVSRRCQGGHRHVELIGGKAAACAKYTDDFCDALVTAISVQIQADRQEKLKTINSVEVHEPENSEYFYVDDVTGETLDKNLVREAREEELKEMESRQVYRRMTVDEARRMGMRSPVKVRWVDRDKGAGGVATIRSRLVAKQFANQVRDDIYAPTPFLESFKMLLSILACEAPKGYRMGVLDVSKAFLYAEAEEDIWIELPEEDPGHAAGLVAKLLKSMYGTRNAPKAWGQHVRRILLGLGFTQGRANSCTYYHKERDLRVIVHVDDFAFVGPRPAINWFTQAMRKEFKITAKEIQFWTAVGHD